MPLLTQAIEQAIVLERVDSQSFCRLSLGKAQMSAGRLEEAHALAEHTLALTREWIWPHDCGHMWEAISPHPSHGF
jgi:hypothetical protein